MCHRNFYGTSDSFSSLETYVEETALSVSSGEVEVTRGEEVRHSEEEMEGGQALSVNRTKVFFSKKEPAEVPLINQAEQASSFSQNYHFVHAELAKLVVDIECASLDQEREQEAHLSNGGVSGESQSQKIVALSIGRKYGLEEEDDDSHAGGLELPNCEEEGCEAGNRSNHSNPNQAIGPPVEIRNQEPILKGMWWRCFAEAQVQVGVSFLVLHFFEEQKEYLTCRCRFGAFPVRDT
ncbi:hypothetical protein VNO80_03599 [Phaseolus coccineus]|uniref:Uncharacterized protein n=1 Tax=Phaseolus coccineus TaxID=3886 RepID=A0AAN9NSK7_PHACN